MNTAMLFYLVTDALNHNKCKSIQAMPKVISNNDLVIKFIHLDTPRKKAKLSELMNSQFTGILTYLSETKTTMTYSIIKKEN